MALQLFDGTGELHELNGEMRFLLRCAALLHDVGWTGGRKGHHKTSLKIIAGSPALPFSRRERLVVGSIARYHRKALPRKRHAHYAALNAGDRRAVRVLGGILRVADALDRSHLSAVSGVSCRVGPRRITLVAETAAALDAERAAIRKKKDLFEMVFERRLALAGPGRRAEG